MPTKVSERFKAAYRLYDRGPRYRVSIAVGQGPEWLCKVVLGLKRVESGDPQVIAAGKLLGLRPEQCFEDCEPPEIGPETVKANQAEQEQVTG